MSKKFADDGRAIGINEEEGTVLLSLHSVHDVFPALHYLEAHPEARSKIIEIQRNPQDLSIADDETEIYRPILVPDDKGRTHGCRNYNFILLNSDIQHPIDVIVREFAEFLLTMAASSPRKVKIKDITSGELPSLIRIAEMREKDKCAGFFRYYVPFRDNFGVPSSMYLYAERFSRGLRSRLGHMGSLQNSPLEERLYLP